MYLPFTLSGFKKTRWNNRFPPLEIIVICKLRMEGNFLHMFSHSTPFTARQGASFAAEGWRIPPARAEEQWRNYEGVRKKKWKEKALGTQTGDHGKWQASSNELPLGCEVIILHEFHSLRQCLSINISAEFRSISLREEHDMIINQESLWFRRTSWYTCSGRGFCGIEL